MEIALKEKKQTYIKELYRILFFFCIISSEFSKKNRKTGTETVWFWSFIAISFGKNLRTYTDKYSLNLINRGLGFKTQSFIPAILSWVCINQLATNLQCFKMLTSLLFLVQNALYISIISALQQYSKLLLFLRFKIPFILD